MKKIVLKAACAMCAVLMAFSIAGCASDEEESLTPPGGGQQTEQPDDTTPQTPSDPGLVPDDEEQVTTPPDDEDKPGNTGGTTDPEPDEGGTTNPDEGETTDPEPDEGGTANPDEGGTTDPEPDEGGTTNPDEGETTDPDEGGTTDPDEGETTDPEPDEGGTTDPEPDEGGTTNPDEGGTTDPDEGGTTNPDEGETTDPEPDEGGTTSPDEGETTDPEPDEGGTTKPDEGETTDPEPDEGGTTTPDEGETTDPEPSQPGGGSQGTDEPEDPVTIPATGEIEFIEAQGHLESAYVTWKAVEGAEWYNVYYMPVGGETWTKIDAPLVRQYPEYFRADIPGLAAGEYLIKVVPTDKDGNELDEKSGTTGNLTVLAHEREGYAFVNGTASGAYNEDGTLKAGARVIYITENTKDSVTLTVEGANENPCVGLQNILKGYAKGKDSTPLCVRIIGNITDLAVMDKGDILVENKNNEKGGITIEGIGSDATANGWGLRIKNSSNVEVRNIGFMNCDSNEGDNLGLQQGNDHVWVHNCDFFYGDAGSDSDQAKGDGALDTKTSSYITHSYNHFWDSGKCNLQGMKSEETSNYITYHHNWYDHSDSRHPRIRTCTVHIYNNYFDGNSKYGVGVTMGASAFVENNYFRSTADMKPMLSSNQGTDADGEGTFSGEDGGIIKSFGNIFDGPCSLITTDADSPNKNDFDCYEAASRDEKISSDYKTLAGGTTYNNFDTAADFYEYQADTAEEAKEKVEKYAGRVGGGDFKWEFDDAKDDASYAVDTELKAALTGYKTELVKVGGEEQAVIVPDPGTGGDGETTDPDTGNEGGTSPEIPAVEGTVIVSFVESNETYYENVSSFVIDGNLSGSKGSVTVGGTTYSQCLKMESSTSITFTTGEKMTLTLYFGTDDSGKVNIDGEKVAISADGTCTVTLEAGSHSIEKGDTMNLFLIVLSPLN